MRIAIVHNTVTHESTPDEQDVLIQAEAVSNTLNALGHEPMCLPCTLDLLAIKKQLEAIKPDMVFNLVESLDGQGRLIHLFPTLLDAMKIPYTGSCAEAIFMTSHKIMAKARMAEVRLPTPEWIGPYPADIPPRYEYKGSLQYRIEHWIIKSLWEHASIGLDEDKLVISREIPEIKDILKKRAPQLGGACFAEQYIDGREFNLSLLADSDGVQLLPPAEIIFEGYDKEKLRIVGYRAKWNADSYEYHHTPRCFDFSPEDEPILPKLKKTAIRCWNIFGLSGYARVDFRVDEDGDIWILEINTNPCISPDAGFAAALEQAGISYANAVERILNSVFTKSF